MAQNKNTVSCTIRSAYTDKWNGHPVLIDRNSGDVRCNAAYCSAEKKRKWFTNHDQFKNKHGIEY